MNPITVPHSRGHWGALEDKETSEPASRFAKGLLPLFAILTAGAFALFHFRIAMLDRELDRTISTFLDVVQAGLESDLRDLIEDAQLLTGAITPESATDLESVNVTRVLRAMSDARGHYHEIRIVGLDGIERHGVRRLADRTRELTLDELNDVHLHDEFIRALQLAPGEVHVSQFDLETDDGRIAEPFRPVLRAITPLLTPSRQQIGLIVLTFDAQPLLESLTLKSARGFVELITTDGYWVKARDEPLQWGFALPERNRVLFSRLFPREWQAIVSTDRGGISTSQGKFWFGTITPGGAASIESRSAPRWKLLLHAPADRIDERNRSVAIPMAIVTFALAILFWFFYWRAVRQDSLAR